MMLGRPRRACTGYWQQSMVYSITPLLHTGAHHTHALSVSLLSQHGNEVAALLLF